MAVTRFSAYRIKIVYLSEGCSEGLSDGFSEGLSNGRLPNRSSISKRSYINILERDQMIK